MDSPASAPDVPTVHVGIVTYNSRADLPACFAGLAAQTYPALTITVLDNASSDGSAAWVEAYAPGARLIVSAENTGFAGGHNRILAVCAPRPGDFYLTLNPDVVMAPSYIAALVAVCAETGAGWATGKLLLLGDAHPPKLYSAGHAMRRDGYAFNIGYGLPDDGRFDSPREVFGAPGAAALISRALIDSIAPDRALFDPDLFLYGEDTDLDWRARRQGWRCWYTPAAVATHRGSRTGETMRRLALANRYLSVIKNASLIDLLTFNLPLIVLHVVARLILTPRHGVALAARLARLGPIMWRRRTRPTYPRAALLGWFRRSLTEPTGQPVTWRARMADAWRRWRAR
jgi:GT2 family glycosyltransferase